MNSEKDNNEAGVGVEVNSNQRYLRKVYLISRINEKKEISSLLTDSYK